METKIDLLQEAIEEMESLERVEKKQAAQGIITLDRELASEDFDDDGDEERLENAAVLDMGDVSVEISARKEEEAPEKYNPQAQGRLEEDATGLNIKQRQPSSVKKQKVNQEKQETNKESA